MKKGYKVESIFGVPEYWHTGLLICNYKHINRVTQYPIVNLEKYKHDYSKIGIWKLKKLKQ